MTNITFLDENNWKRIVINGIVSNYIINSDAVVYNTKRNMVMKPNRKKKQPKVLNKKTMDYLGLRLSVNGVYHDVLLHRIVALAYIPLPEALVNKGYTVDMLEVDHLDCDKSHNEYTNLEWVTPQENMRRMFANNLDRHCSGENHGLCSYTDEQIRRVCKLLEENKLNMTEISRITEVPYKTISKIKNGAAFVNISKQYKISNFNKSIRIYDDEQIESALRMRLKFPDMSIREISNESGINYQTLKNIFQRKIHTQVYDKVFKIK